MDKQTGYKTKCLLTFPLVADKECLGVVTALNKIGAPAFTAEDEKVRTYTGLVCAHSHSLSELEQVFNTESLIKNQNLTITVSTLSLTLKYNSHNYSCAFLRSLSFFMWTSDLYLTDPAGQRRPLTLT